MENKMNVELKESQLNIIQNLLQTEIECFCHKLTEISENSEVHRTADFQDALFKYRELCDVEEKFSQAINFSQVITNLKENKNG